MDLAITIIFAVLALGWVRNTKKQATKIATILLAISSLIQYDPYFGLSSYGDYFLIFFSFFAAIEAMNSIRMTKAHQAFFLGSASVIALFRLLTLIDFPFYIPKYPFAILYLILFGSFVMISKRKITSRMGILLVWLGVALNWLIAAF